MGARNQYEALASAIENLEIKGKTMRYTSINGNMFSFISKDDEIGIRLSQKDRALIISMGGEPMMQHGRPMKEYIHIQEFMLNDIEVLPFWIKKSINYARTLKPKPTTRKQ
ncbi:MAG: hypothetical protein JXR19_01515 [Bacteroidia bacterium]